MSSRAIASSPAISVCRSVPVPRIAPWKARWRSSSDGMIDLRGGARGFGEEGGQRRKVLVPLDQGRRGSETLPGVTIERPDIVADGRAVIVDQQESAIARRDGVAGEMEFADGFSRQGAEKAV